MIARALDALAAAATGAGVFLIALGVKPLPSTIEITMSRYGGLGWIGFLLLGSVAAMAGSLLRTRDGSRRGQIAAGLELSGWFAVASSAGIYAWATVSRFGWESGAITAGLATACGLLAAGRWWSIRQALTVARRAEKARP